jgi:hypothetical protein
MSSSCTKLIDVLVDDCLFSVKSDSETEEKSIVMEGNSAWFLRKRRMLNAVLANCPWNPRMDLWFTFVRNVEQHAFEKNQNLLDIFSGLIFVSERQWPVMAMVFAHHILFSGVTYFCMLAKK